MPRPFVPAVDVAKIELHYLVEGQKVENVIYSRKPGGFDLAGLQALCGAVKLWWTGALKPVLSDAITLTDIKATDMSDVNGPTFTYTTGLPEAGTQAGGAFPNNVSLAAKLNSAGRGRSVTGRFFLAGLPRSIATGSSLNSGYQAALVSVFDALITDLFTVGATWVICSFIGGGNLRLTALISEVVAITVDSVLDSQRRRLPGRGR